MDGDSTSSFCWRYVPDAVKDEFVNLGVVLYQPGQAGSGEAGFADVRFTRDWRRLWCLDPDVDLEMLEALEREIRERLAEGGKSREWLLGKMEDSFSNAIRLTPAKAVLAESPQAEMESLAQLYLERTRRAGRSFSGRQMVFGKMRDEFERHGVWQFMRKGIAVAEYTHRGDPLKIDCGYAPQKTVRAELRRVAMGGSSCFTRSRWRQISIRRRCWPSAFRSTCGHSAH